jgi:hypothetical protein
MGKTVGSGNVIRGGHAPVSLLALASSAALSRN